MRVDIAVAEIKHACWWSSYKQTTCLLQLLCLFEEVTVCAESLQVDLLKSIWLKLWRMQLHWTSSFCFN